MSMPLLSHFPDLCLLSIFAHLPLLDVIASVGRVCVNWSRLQKDELKSRRTLNVLPRLFYYNPEILQNHEDAYGSNLISHVRREDGSPWAPPLPPLKQIQFDALLVPGDVLRSSFTTPLVHLLPHLTHLTIMLNYTPLHSSISTLELMNNLLIHYSVNLVSLKLGFSITNFTEDEMRNFQAHLETRVHVLFDSINRLESLQHLTLNVNFTGFNPQPSLTILSRLVSFTVHKFYPLLLLIDILTQFATENVQVQCDFRWHLSSLIKLKPQLANRFTRLSITDRLCLRDYENTQLLCDRFQSLTILLLSIASMPMTMLARCLFQVTQLVHLKLYFESTVPQEERTPQLEIARVPSVRLLTLDIRTRSHHDTARLQPHTIFPNLQVLHFTHFSGKCGECEYQLDNDYFNKRIHAILILRILRCMGLARNPFKLCDALHTIELETWKDLKKWLPQGLITVDQL